MKFNSSSTHSILFMCSNRHTEGDSLLVFLMLALTNVQAFTVTSEQGD